MFENLSVTDSFKNSIISALSQGRLSHALIFEGVDDVTRLSAAKETAKALVCKGDNKPCGVCTCCLKAASDSHPDIHILMKSDDSNMIKVDEIRELRVKAQVYPNEAAKSVFIIHDAQYMNTQSQNALLKIFEEPSQHVSFILTCDSKSSLLETVISRATLYSLGDVKTYAGKSEADIIAQEKAKEFLQSFIKENEFEFLKKTNILLKDKDLFKSVIESMLSVVRDALILQSGGKELLSEEADIALLIKNQLTQKKTLLLIDKLKELISDSDSSANHNLTVTRFVSVLYNIKTH